MSDTRKAENRCAADKISIQRIMILLQLPGVSPLHLSMNKLASGEDPRRIRGDMKDERWGADLRGSRSVGLEAPTYEGNVFVPHPGYPTSQ